MLDGGEIIGNTAKANIGYSFIPNRGFFLRLLAGGVFPHEFGRLVGGPHIFILSIGYAFL
jgi:hypothetical protein